jgi:hypothetical protein
MPFFGVRNVYRRANRAKGEGFGSLFSAVCTVLET